MVTGGLSPIQAFVPVPGDCFLKKKYSASNVESARANSQNAGGVGIVRDWVSMMADESRFASIHKAMVVLQPLSPDLPQWKILSVRVTL